MSTLPIERHAETKGYTFKYQTACGKLFISINYQDNNLIECFIHPSKTGGCAANIEGLGRMISLAMRYSISLEHILKQLHFIRCPACMTIRVKEQEKIKLENKGKLPTNFQHSVGFSCPDLIAKAIAKSHKMLEKKEGKDGKGIQEKV